MIQLTIIIPALNEADFIQKTLEQLLEENGIEIILVDGGSQDKTVKIARSLGVKVICSCQRGRAYQMNLGAAAARGEILLFLHADTYLPTNYLKIVKETLEKPETVAGAFELAIAGEQKLLRLVAAAVNWRSRFFSLPYGDQSLFLKASIFRQLGGFANLAIMEDFELVRRLQRQGKIRIAPAKVITSNRRWQTRGILRTTAINQLIILGYYLGISPRILARWYGRK